MTGFKDESAVVIGRNAGSGREASTMFAQERVHLVIVARPAGKDDETPRLIAEAGGKRDV